MDNKKGKSWNKDMTKLRKRQTETRPVMYKKDNGRPQGNNFRNWNLKILLHNKFRDIYNICIALSRIELHIL